MSESKRVAREEREAMERDPIGCTVNVLDQLVAQAEAGGDIIDSMRGLRDELEASRAPTPEPEREPGVCVECGTREADLNGPVDCPSHPAGTPHQFRPPPESEAVKALREIQAMAEVFDGRESDRLVRISRRARRALSPEQEDES